MEEFQGFSKIARFNREVIVTEKIDGTNAQIYITDTGEFYTGSRTRWITPDDDNYGFSRWANKNREQLTNVLGPGRHYGEWWGSGIQRGYGLTKGERRFSLFNTSRWVNGFVGPCLVVPVLWQGSFEALDIKSIMSTLQQSGSQASPGFMYPEGIVLYHTAANLLLKKTFIGDEGGKGHKEG